VRRRRPVVVSYARFAGYAAVCRGRSVETSRYVELSHVLRVLCLQVVQGFQDHWLTWCDCWDSSRRARLRNPRVHKPRVRKPTCDGQTRRIASRMTHDAP
jgi:hypothetical protein